MSRRKVAASLLSAFLIVSGLAWPHARAEAEAGIAAPTASPGAVAVASSVKVETRGVETRLVFSLSSAVSARAYVLGDPDRVIVDLPQIDFRIDPDVGRPLSSGRGVAERILGGVVKSFRFGLFSPGKSRIVVDLAGPARVVRAASEPGPNGGVVFVLELAGADAAAFRAAAAAPPPVEAAAPPPLEAGAPQPDALPMVVLDPGHGGVDAGALGPPGVVEKTITLAFATSVAARLRADGLVRVALTRTQDVFVPLGERVRIARQADASLFMSIHADSIVGAASVSGATIYTLSNKASDAAAARFAAKENAADAAGGLSDKAKGDQDEVEDILFDLTRRETRAYSNIFAKTLMQTWRSAGPLNHNPHRSAAFVVLKAPDTPSVLLELGYLSSAKDVRSLTDPAWRDKAAAAVAHAIENFFTARRSDVAVGGSRPGSGVAPTDVAVDKVAHRPVWPPGAPGAP